MKPASIASAALHFVQSYAAAAPRAAYWLGAGLVLQPRRAQDFVHRLLDGVDVGEDDPVLRTVDITDLVPSENVDVCIRGPYQRGESSDTRQLRELTSLAYLTAVTRPKVLFEIGTFVGRTTRLFALNSAPDMQILTLDLPGDAVEHEVGRDFQGTPEAARITQLVGDSLRFDFSPWYGRCDFVWVDACHDYEYVKSDTEHALRLVRPGGWVGWHDYRHSAFWSGVTRCVRETAKAQPGVVFLRGTTTALLQTPR